MARTQGVSLSDFEADDQAILQQHSKPKAPVDNSLLALAERENLIVTSGFSSGGHNKGSKHYLGDAQHPGAIDVDHRNVTPEQIHRLESQGYRVLDERTRPKGQAKWTGPHYHIERRNGGIASQKKELPKTTRASRSSAMAPVDLTMPTSTDADGNVIFNGVQPSSNVPTFTRKNKDIKSKTVSDALDLSEFDLTPEELAQVKQTADRLKPKPKPQAPVVKPQTNFFGDIASHAANAAAGYTQDDLIRSSGQGVGAFIGDTVGGLVPIAGASLLGAGAGSVIPGAGTVGGAITGGIAGAGAAGTAQDLQAQRLEGAKDPNWGRAIGAGGIQAGLQAIPGVGKSLPLIKRAAANMAIQGLGAGAGSLAQQGFEQGTFTPKVDVNRTLGMTALGAAGGVVAGASHGGAKKASIKEVPNAELPKAEIPQYKTEADMIRRLGQLDQIEKAKNNLKTVNKGALPLDTASKLAELDQSLRGQIRAIPEAANRPSINVNDYNLKEQQLKELSDAFAERNKPTEAPQVIDPRKPQNSPSTPAILNAQGELTGQPAQALEKASALPEGRSMGNEYNPITGQKYQDLPSKSAKESAETLNAYESDLSTAQKIRQDALEDLQAKVDTLRTAAGVDDIVEAQQTIGKRINELETKPSLSADEYNELLAKQSTLKDVLNAQKAMNEADSLLNETGQKTARSSLDIPEPQKPGLPSTRELALKRAEAIAEQPDVNTPESQRLPDNATTNLSNKTREIGASPLLDSTGRPFGETGIARELEIPGRGKPVDPNALELPKRQKLQDIGSGSDKVGMVPEVSKTKELAQDNQMPVAKASEVRQAVNTLPITDAPVNPAKPRTAETAQAAQSQGIELMNVADARDFIRKYQPDQVSHFDNVLEAAKNNQTISVSHKPLAAGGMVENAREIHPVDFGKKTIQGRTEVANLLKQFAPNGKPDESAFSAVRDNLVQRLAANKISVSAKDQNITGGKPLTIKRKLNALANRLPEHERTHVYIMDHNLDATERGQSYGFRRIDRITESGLTGKPQSVPEASPYQNRIKPAFDTMRQIADMPETPKEVASAIKNITNNGKINRKESARMKEWLRNNYSSFCQLFGLE